MKHLHKLKNVEYWLYATFFVALGFSLWSNSVGWTNPIYDRYGFRQAQTAISVFYMLKGGSLLAYETPVLGAPWSIPFEFPLYQWIVALFSFLFAAPIDRVGRVVSLLAYYGSFFPAYFVLRHLNFKRSHCYAMFALVLCCPIYLFWSRTFMIESLAILLSFGYLAYLCRYLEDQSKVPLVLLTGALGAMVKITTFLGFTVAAAFLILRWWMKKEKFRVDWAVAQRALVCLSFALVPVLCLLSWTQYADHLKSLNPFANNFITSQALSEWNFGTWSQRFDQGTLDRIYQFEFKDLLGKVEVFYWALGISFIFFRSLPLFTVCLFLYVLAPLVFTNLHQVHEYYVYANGIFLVAAVGVAIISLLKQSHPSFHWFGVGALIYVCFIFSDQYLNHQYNFQKGSPVKDWKVSLGELIEKVTEENEIVLYWGQDWSPVLPYQSKRRALMDRSDRKLDDPDFKTALGNLAPRKIGAMVVCGHRVHDDQFLKSRFAKFDMHSRSVGGWQGCNVYVRNGRQVAM